MAVTFGAAEWARVEAHAARAGVEPEQFVREAVRARVSSARSREDRRESARRTRISASKTRQEASAVLAQSEQAVRRMQEVRERASRLLGEALGSRRSLVFVASPDFREMRSLTTPLEWDSLDAWLEAHVHPEDHTGARAAIERAVDGGGVLVFEHRVLGRDGSPGSGCTRAVPMLRDDGEIAEWLGVSTADDRLDATSPSIE